MDWRTQRQLIVILIFFLLVFGIGGSFAFWVFNEPPTCIDSKRNQGEDEADCGGPCVPCALKRQKAPEVLFTRVIRVRQNTYDVVAHIQNPNDHLAGNSLGYRVRVFDDQGAEVGRRENRTHVYPSDKVYIVESNFSTERTVAGAVVEFIPENTVWTFTAEIRPELTLGNRRFEVIREGAAEYAQSTAVLTNRSPFTFRNADVRVLLLDEKGNVLLAGATEIHNVQSGEAREIIFTWPEKPRGEVKRIDMEARANALDPKNLIPL